MSTILFFPDLFTQKFRVKKHEKCMTPKSDCFFYLVYSLEKQIIKTYLVRVHLFHKVLIDLELLTTLEHHLLTCVDKFGKKFPHFKLIDIHVQSML